MSPELEAQSLNHWTTREVPLISFNFGNIFSQVLFCVTDVERALGFINDYTLSSLLEASLALRERGGGKDSPAFIDKPSSAVSSVRAGHEQMFRKYLLKNKKVTFQKGQ